METPCFHLLVSQGGNPGTSILGDVTNIMQDEEEDNLEEEFTDEAITNYLEEGASSGHFRELHPSVHSENGCVDSENGSAPSKNDSAVQFLELDQDLLQQVTNGGISKSEVKLQWARRWFDTWRVHSKIPCDKRIEELDQNEFAGMLEIFMLQVVNLIGRMFPPRSLQDIFRIFGAIIRHEQESKVAESGIEKVPFNIKHSVIFTKARLACVVAMRRSRMTAGVYVKRKKADEISFANKQALLADVDHGIHHSMGIQKRILFYLVSRFGIRGQDGLTALKVYDFHVASENGREFVEYSERLSKQYDVDMNRYKEEQFRMPLHVCEEDVIVTFK